MKPRTAVLIAALPLVALAACEAKKSANPLSPSVAGPIPGVSINAPGLVSPAHGGKLKPDEQPVALTVENASTTGVRPLTYLFELALDDAFSNKVFVRSGVAPGEGRTSVTLPSALPTGRAYYWRARAEDGANTGPFASPAAFEVLAPVVIHPPVALTPSGNEQVTTRTPVLRARNADRSGPAGNIFYQFQLSRDQGFTQIVASDLMSEGYEGETWYPVSQALDFNQSFYWRVRATNNEVTTSWSSTEVFRTSAAAPPPGGGGGGGGGGGTGAGTPCGPPYPSTPQGIVECQRSKYGFMGHDQIVEFLRAVARDLNAAGIPGGPFGLLVKTSGNNCHGYSCDIICAGQGGSQRQYDVLGDAEGAQTPGWGGPLDSIVVRPCEIQ